VYPAGARSSRRRRELARRGSAASSRNRYAAHANRDAASTPAGACWTHMDLLAVLLAVTAFAAMLAAIELLERV
jgi:hypothetical protein